MALAPTEPPSSPGPGAPTPQPTPYVLQLSNVDGPPVDVLIGDHVVTHLECAGYGRLTSGEGGIPDLPWQLTVRRSSGGIMFGPTPVVGGENFVLLIRDTDVMLGEFGSNGPTSLPCSRWASPRPTSGSPVGRPTPIESVSISPDHTVVTLHFIGGPPLASTDPCFTEYAATAERSGDRLEVTVLQTAGLTSTTPCLAIGYLRALTITLPEPFDGTTVVDRAGFVHFVSPPAGLLEPHRLPAAWLLRSQGDVAQSVTGRWRRVYSPVANPGPVDRQVELYQSFGSVVDISGGPERSNVTVNGNPGMLWHDPSTGELLVTWTIGPDGFGLVANERDFTPAEALGLAASVR